MYIFSQTLFFVSDCFFSSPKRVDPFMHDAEMQQIRGESNVNPRSKGRRGTGQRKIAVAYDTAIVWTRFLECSESLLHHQG